MSVGDVIKGLFKVNYTCSQFVRLSPSFSGLTPAQFQVSPAVKRKQAQKVLRQPDRHSLFDAIYKDKKNG